MWYSRVLTELSFTSLQRCVTGVFLLCNLHTGLNMQDLAPVSIFGIVKAFI